MELENEYFVSFFTAGTIGSCSVSIKGEFETWEDFEDLKKGISKITGINVNDIVIVNVQKFPI